MDKYISFNQFTFQYDAQAEAMLKDISFDIAKGEKVLILGPSGSGKSTLAQCLNGIIPNIHKGQAQGQVRIDGQDIFKQSIYDKSQLVSTVLQDPDGQFIGLTVAEDLAFALENDCADQSEMKDKVALWAERLDLTSLLNHRPQDLSGGQKQRVSLAGVLIDESPILLFDEPLANLDPKSGQETIDLIDKIHKEVGATTIIIEHRLEDVLYRPVDRILLVNEGELIFNGSPDELLSSTLLLENGIREPLYVTVLRQLGFDTRSAQNLSQLDALDLSDLALPDRVLKDKRDSSSDSILKVEGLSVSYGDNPTIIEDLSFSLKKGERLAIVGNLFTFFSSWLTNKAMPERNGSATTMMYVMPVMIFFFALFSASGVALYWVTSNAYQVGQTYLLNNPFKIIAEREAKEQASRDMEKQKRRALNKAQKKKK